MTDTMWTARNQPLPQGSGIHFAVDHDGQAASYADVVRAWQGDAEFRSWFNSLLADASYTAFRWETPAVTSATFERSFEFVLLYDPYLARRPDRQAFAAQFQTAGNGAQVIAFPNLSGDAQLVVPCSAADDSAYGHLAAFVRLAPAAQRDELWRAVGNTMQQRIGAKPVWLSTAGAGVSWLHVRLDNRPKYYSHAPYHHAP